ncbi:MAG TPA: MetQ/NlpA family ABC transporter substrate-binding protein [Coxiellaceae bacterium]|nr:MetQ/NlpA family ABC transporter substrate-binding protein [Coxiellaceae bacterium]
MIKLIKKISVPVFFILLSACSQGTETTSDDVMVGVIAGPEAQLMEVARKVALKNFGIDIKITNFTDYNIPNRALCDGSINANIFQHLPFLQQQQKKLDCKLVPIARTFIFPMGLYSRQITNLSQLPNGAVVAIPNDPTNEARALFLLQSAGLIGLRAGADINATTQDVVSNPKQLQFAELDAAQLPRALGDVAIAAINTTFAIPAGLSPQNALYAEDSSSRYANLIVVRAQDVSNVKNASLVAAYHSPQVVAAAKRIFGGSAIPAW